jgi:hypothetical protein
MGYLDYVAVVVIVGAIIWFVVRWRRRDPADGEPAVDAGV